MLKAAVIGAGAFGRHHARKYAEDERVRLVGVYDPDDERAHMLAETHHVAAFDAAEDLVAEADIVTVASLATTHAAMARLALDAGCHVLVEKPLATNVADGEDLVERARAAERVLACGHQERLIVEAIGLMQAPEPPMLIECVRAAPWTGRGADVSVTLDLMTHDIDMALALLRCAPQRVSVSGRCERGVDVDHLEAEARFDGGGTARFLASRIAEDRARSLRVVYPSGEVRVDFVARTFHNSTPFALNADFAETPDSHDPLAANVKRFISAALGQAPAPPVTGAEALDALRLAAWFDSEFLKGSQ
ncbi:MAG: gfo/Idh/MocA family oxidoreductase [Alphaproteobacteria bacterium]|nr:gfo/Idh/MocA family oxidoreductase [Alphaproteobacteria bacterium]